MTVVFADVDADGLAGMVGGLIEQNLARDPSRLRLLRPAVVSIDAADAGVAITLTIAPGCVTVSGAADPDASIAIVTDAARLLALTAVPLRFGFPDPFHREGRAVLLDVAARRVRIQGMLAHPRRLARLSSLLSAR